MNDVTTLKSSGDSSKRVDIALIAEGYTAAERGKFLSDSQNFINYLFSAANKTNTDPFYSYSTFFNVHAAFTASQQSGYDTATVTVNTAFDAKAYLDDGRLVYGSSTKVAAFANSVLQPTQQDIVIVLVNSSQYGGAGGSVAWATAGNPLSYEVALHEIGHSYAGLQDEYIDGAIASQYPLSVLNTSVHIAATADLSTVPWKDWVGFSDGLGPVGAYEGGYYRTTGVWRATENSKMLTLNTAFSAPQKEQFINRFYDVVNDYTALAAKSLIHVAASTPQNSLFKATWTANGQALVATGTEANLETYIRGLADGAHTLNLVATIDDASGFLRKAAVKANAQDVETVSLSLTKATYGAAADVITVPTTGGHFIIAGGGDDRVSLSSGGHFIDGGTGGDAITYANGRQALKFTSAGDGTFKASSVQGGALADILTGIETVAFADGGALPLVNLIAESALSWASYNSDVEVVAATYQFFTGTLPSAQGFSYLIDSALNAADLNDSYYLAFNRENRFINFAGNLSSVGTGKDKFLSEYGTLSFNETIAKAFNVIVGNNNAPDLNASLNFFLSAKGYYEAVAAQRVVTPLITLDQATKIVALGSILNEATKADLGIYGKAVASLGGDVYTDAASAALGQDLFAFFA